MNFLKLKGCILAFICLFGLKGNAENFDKWIVVTTIQYPTEALRKVANIPGWKLVVVADKKTPKDWHLDDCEFLSVEKQLELDYEILKFLPWNHYCRKNIGYLYAIEHGAKYIYETDDDNFPIDGISILLNDDEIQEIDSSDSVANIYAYFGEPTVWPRGYPLNKIASSKEMRIQKLTHPVSIGVVQGLVDKSPDVDAIYRLTQDKEIYFTPNLPCVLKEGVFCPYNTQNTLSESQAFWGLLVPSTTPFRVCDIWRSYFTQRLLWDVDLRLCFVSPTAIQERNPHDCFKDFCDEQDLYLDVNRLIDCLLKWKDFYPNFETRFVNLIQVMAGKGFVKKSDVDLAKAWINDLIKIGYLFPKVRVNK
jgi:hypothetical protein